MPCILMPPICPHGRLSRAISREEGVEPTHVIEADQESLIANLVVSGVGVSLLPDPLALDMQAAGRVCISEKTVMSATLWFIYLRERANDPLIKGIVELIRSLWNPEKSAAAASRVA